MYRQLSTHMFDLSQQIPDADDGAHTYKPVAASGRHSIMVRSMEADSRQGRVCGCPDAAAAGGCHATECTQSSWPISTDSSMAVSREPPAWMRGLGAYLMIGTTWLECDAARASPPSCAC